MNKIETVNNYPLCAIERDFVQNYCNELVEELNNINTDTITEETTWEDEEVSLEELVGTVEDFEEEFEENNKIEEEMNKIRPEKIKLTRKKLQEIEKQYNMYINCKFNFNFNIIPDNWYMFKFDDKNPGLVEVTENDLYEEMERYYELSNTTYRGEDDEMFYETIAGIIKLILKADYDRSLTLYSSTLHSNIWFTERDEIQYVIRNNEYTLLYGGFKVKKKDYFYNLIGNIFIVAKEICDTLYKNYDVEED